jgi:hypothetical protein
MQDHEKTIYEWYRLGRNRGEFLRQIRGLDGPFLLRLALRENVLKGEGRLRTRHELEELGREPCPPLEDLRLRKPNEQTLQWFFLHRGYIASSNERVLCRELPSCRCGETVAGKGRADLLAFDRELSQPMLVELKRADNDEPLCAVVLEILFHWCFHGQFHESFELLLREFECGPARPTRLVIAAPVGYFREARRRSQDRIDGLCGEFRRALAWITALRELVQIDLYAIEDQWLAKGPKFLMSRLEA